MLPNIVKVYCLVLLTNFLVKCEELPDSYLSFDILVKNSELTCEPALKQPIFTVLEHQKVTIISKYLNDEILKVREFKYDKTEPLTETEEVRGKNRIAMSVLKVTANMSNVWTFSVERCPDENCKLPEGERLAKTYCSKRVHVRLIESPIRITVNRTIIDTPRNTDINNYIDNEGEYFYTDGEYVEVFCSKSPQKQGELSLFYSDGKRLDEKFEEVAGTADLGFGFKTTLHSRHNNSYLLCTLQNKDDKNVAQVKFIKKNNIQALSDTITVKVGNTTIHPHKSADDKVKMYHEYYDDEIFSVHFEINKDLVNEIKFDEIQPDTCVQSINQNPDEKALCIHVSFQINKNCSPNMVTIKCTAILKTGAYLHVEMNFVSANDNNISSKDLLSSCPLEVNGLDRNNIDLLFYHPPKFQRIYYYYSAGDPLTVFCQNKRCDERLDTKTSLTWSSDHYDNLNISGVSLTPEDDGSVINCSVIEQSDMKSIRNITITLLYKSKDIVTTSTLPTENSDDTWVPYTVDDEGSSVPGPSNTIDQDVDDMKWIFVAVGIFTCLVIVCVVTVIYKIKRRGKEQKPTSYKNLAATSETSIPAHPTQWDGNYAVPSDLRSESPKYSVPVGSNEAVYTVPIPKSLRIPKPYEVTYAHLDNKVLARAPARKQNQDKEDLTYAEVNCYVNIDQGKTSQTTYDNVFDGSQYVNSDDREYIEPTYCEATIKRKK